MGEELTSEEVNHLEGASAGDDDLTVADEGEIVAAFAAEMGVVGHEHQAEARGVVVVLGVRSRFLLCGRDSEREKNPLKIFQFFFGRGHGIEKSCTFVLWNWRNYGSF